MVNVTNATLSTADRLAAIAQQNLQNATNATVEQVTTQAPNIVVALFTRGIPLVGERIWQLLSAPVKIPEMQWAILPLLITVIVIETYFFRNVNEELGWNSAVGNSLVLVYVAIDLARQLFPETSPLGLLKEGFRAILIVTVNFFHLLPKSIAYKIGSHLHVNYIAFVAVVLVYSSTRGMPIPIDVATVIAATIIFTLFLGIMFAIQRAPGIQVIQRLRGGE
jgi:hypothetical protein